MRQLYAALMYQDRLAALLMQAGYSVNIEPLPPEGPQTRPTLAWQVSITNGRAHRGEVRATVIEALHALAVAVIDPPNTPTAADLERALGELAGGPPASQREHRATVVKRAAAVAGAAALHALNKLAEWAGEDDELDGGDP